MKINFDQDFHLRSKERVSNDERCYSSSESVLSVPSLSCTESDSSSITDEDLFAIAGHILIQPKVVNEKWGGGKIYY